MDLPQAVQLRIAVLEAAEGGSPGWAGADAPGGACMYGAAPGAGGTAPLWGIAPPWAGG